MCEMNSMNELTCVLLPNQEVINALSIYKRLLLSLMRKKIISITTMGGHTNYLSTNSLDEIGFQNEIISLINSMITKLPSHNVYAGILISTILNKLWSEPICNCSVHETTKIIMDFKNLLDKAIGTLKYRIDLLDVVYLQRVLENVLTQEPTVLFSKGSLNEFTHEIVKGVLRTVNTEDSFKPGQFYVHLSCGTDNFKMFSGIICEVDDETSALIERAHFKQSLNQPLLLLIDSINDPKSYQLIIESNAKLVMCQKSISNLLKVMLRRSGIVAVERIGLEVAKNVEQMTGCSPICSLSSLTVNEIINKAGFYDTFHLQVINHLNYIVLERQGSHISTFYVACRTFNSLSYTKKVCYKCISTVCSMISSPYLLPGPITFEEQLICCLKSTRVIDETMSQIVLQFCSVLSELRDLKNELKVKHDKIGGLFDCGDIYHLKRNALMFSLDAVINLLNIGLIVRKY